MGKTKTHEQFMEDFELKNKHFNDIEIIGKYIGANKSIECKCKIDNHIWYPLAINLLNGCGCPVCANLIIMIGINDMWTTAPDVAKLLANLEDGYKYMKGSKTKVDWKCPDCGSTIKNKSIVNVNKHRLSCNICSDGISYPQKFMANVLQQLDVDFETECIFDWCKFKLNNEDYSGRYDFVFTYDNQNYIVETDGKLGHGKTLHPKSKLTNEDYIYIDNMKNKLAEKNNYELIRIDCNFSEFEIIKNNIINSKLNNLFNLNNIDWDLCHKSALKSKVIEACELWNSGIKSLIEIGKILKLSRATVRVYLKNMQIIGLCDYNSKTHMKYNGKLLGEKVLSKPVICVNTGEIFDSARKACKFYNFNLTVVSCCARGETKTGGKHPITGERLIWKYL